MSRVGKKPIAIPQGVEVKVSGSSVAVKGPKGNLDYEFPYPQQMGIALEDNAVQVSCNSALAVHRAMYGTTRALIANMITGVSQGFTKVLQLWGVGYSADSNAKQVILNIGFCHKVEIPIPEGLSVTTERISVEGNNVWKITVAGIDKQKVGQLAAVIRKIRPPEPYKGKGIRYENERIIRKAGKSFQSGG